MRQGNTRITLLQDDSPQTVQDERARDERQEHPWRTPTQYQVRAWKHRYQTSHGPRCGHRSTHSSICTSAPSAVCGTRALRPQCTWIGAARRGSHDLGLDSEIASASNPLPQADGLLAQAASEMGARGADAASGRATGSTAFGGSWHAAVSPPALRRTSRSGMGEGVCSATRSWRSRRASVHSPPGDRPRLLDRKAPTRLPRLLASGSRRHTRCSTASGSCSSSTWRVFAPRSSWQSATGPATFNSGGAQRRLTHLSSSASSSGKVFLTVFCKSW